MMTPEKKVWGTTVCRFEARSYSRHELQLIEGGYCSFHYHKSRANVFRVNFGIVRIVTAVGWDVSEHILTKDNEFEVPSMVPHQFQVLANAEMIEEYYADRGHVVADPADIVRLTIGSKCDVAILRASSSVVLDENAKVKLPIDVIGSETRCL